MSSLSESPFASNEPLGLRPMSPPASGLFGSLGLMVATVNLSEDESSACAPQSGVSKLSIVKTIHRTENSWSILKDASIKGLPPDIPSGIAYYRTESSMGFHGIAFRECYRLSGSSSQTGLLPERRPSVQSRKLRSRHPLGRLATA